MKKIKVVLVALIFGGLALTSCGGDDNDAPATPATLFGKWTPTTIVTKTGTQPEVSVPYANNETGCDKDYIQFIEAGSVFKDQYFYKGPQNLCTEGEEVAPSTFIKATDNTTLKINGDSQYAETYTMSLSNTQLSISFSVQLGTDTVKRTYKFTKVN